MPPFAAAAPCPVSRWPPHFMQLLNAWDERTGDPFMKPRSSLSALLQTRSSCEAVAIREPLPRGILCPSDLRGPSPSPTPCRLLQHTIKRACNLFDSYPATAVLLKQVRRPGASCRRPPCCACWATRFGQMGPRQLLPSAFQVSCASSPVLEASRCPPWLPSRELPLWLRSCCCSYAARVPRRPATTAWTLLLSAR